MLYLNVSESLQYLLYAFIQRETQQPEVLIREICNSIIAQAVRYINGSDIFTMISSEETVECYAKLENTYRICTAFKARGPLFLLTVSAAATVCRFCRPFVPALKLRFFCEEWWITFGCDAGATFLCYMPTKISVSHCVATLTPCHSLRTCVRLREWMTSPLTQPLGAILLHHMHSLHMPTHLAGLLFALP